MVGKIVRREIHISNLCTPTKKTKMSTLLVTLSTLQYRNVQVKKHNMQLFAYVNGKEIKVIEDFDEVKDMVLDHIRTNYRDVAPMDDDEFQIEIVCQKYIDDVQEGY